MWQFARGFLLFPSTEQATKWISGACCSFTAFQWSPKPFSTLPSPVVVPSVQGLGAYSQFALFSLVKNLVQPALPVTGKTKRSICFAEGSLYCPGGGNCFSLSLSLSVSVWVKKKWTCQGSQVVCSFIGLFYFLIDLSWLQTGAKTWDEGQHFLFPPQKWWFCNTRWQNAFCAKKQGREGFPLPHWS